MKTKFLVPAMAMVTLGLFAGCSSDSADSSSPVSLNEKEFSGEYALVDLQDAKTHLARYRRSVVDSWQFDSSSAETSENVALPIDSALQNENFAIDADVVVKDDSTYTVASAGVDGDGFAWILQVEDGAVVYSWRENAKSDWQKFKTEKDFDKNRLNNVRIERAEAVIVVSVNGKIVAAFRDEVNGSLVLKGELTIGFDKKELDKCHCKNGRVEQLGLEVVDEIEDIPVDSVQEPDTLDVPVDTSVVSSDSVVTTWIAEWDFNEASNVGFDATENGHDATIGEGAVPSVEGIASFDGESGFTVSLDSNININEFVVEARVKPTQFGTMQNIIVAEPPGRGVDGWQLRIDESVLTVHLRDTDKDGDDWTILPGKAMALDEWCEIRLERSADSVKLFQNGEIAVAEAYTGDLTQMAYDWSIGYDGMQQDFHERYFVGEMDYVRFGKFEGFTVGAVAPKNQKLLAAWEFNEPKFIGLDRMANNSTHYLVGSPLVAATTLELDGRSGLQVNLSKTFRRNTFAVEARVKPAAFGEMQNIIVAEPPGRYGDGWIIRLDSGVVTAHFRDEDTDGTTWNVYSGKKLALGEWNDIRVERSADSIKIFQNGELTASAETKGDVSQLGYNIGIAYDAMNQAKHDRYFNGEIDYIRYYGL